MAGRLGFSAGGQEFLPRDVTHHPFVPEIRHFLECIENNVESHAAIYDSYRSMALCFAIDESAANNGKPVKVDYKV